MRNIPIRKLIFLLGILFLIQPAWSQQKNPPNLPKYDLSPYHFGFIIGMNQMFFVVTPIPDLRKQDTIYAVEAKPSTGFNIGIVSNLRLGYHWDLRFIPTLSFGERNVLFTQAFNNNKEFYTIVKKVESTYLDFPFELKFKSARLYNARAYVLTGIKFSIDMASQANKKTSDEEIRIKLKKNDYSFEFGVGWDFYTTYFKFGTEIKMAYGVRDLLSHENNIYAQTIQRLSSKIFQFTFTFE